MAERILMEPSYIARLSDAFRDELSGCEVHYEHVGADRYRFIVIWDKFDEMDHPERQHLVWRIADCLLDQDELFKVTMILTLGLEDLPHD